MPPKDPWGRLFLEPGTKHNSRNGTYKNAYQWYKGCTVYAVTATPIRSELKRDCSDRFEKISCFSLKALPLSHMLNDTPCETS